MNFLSQNDISWKLKRINGTTSTLGSYGCLVVCINWIMNQAGYQITPPELATKSELFSDSMWVGWTKLEGLYPKMHYVWGERCDTTPAPIDKIVRELDDGYFPIIMLDYAPKTTGLQTHYLTVLSHDKDNNLQVGDPIDGSIVWLDSRYGELDEKYKILKVDVYHHEKPEITPDLWDRIKTYLTQENNFTEGDIREGMDMFKNKASREKEIQDLKDSLLAKQQKLTEKDNIISELTNQVNAKDEAIKHTQNFLVKLATMLGGTISPSEASITEGVSSLIGCEAKVDSLMRLNQDILSKQAETVKKEVEKQSYDIKYKLAQSEYKVVQLEKQIAKYESPSKPTLLEVIKAWVAKQTK